jgi:hypothetical protein
MLLSHFPQVVLEIEMHENNKSRNKIFHRKIRGTARMQSRSIEQPALWVVLSLEKAVEYARIY